MIELRPITQAEAFDFIRKYHRHHSVPVGALWWHAVHDSEGVLRGVAIVGRPVARRLDDGFTVEVTRLCTDGTPNACSMLYGAARRVALDKGYRRGVTYTLPDNFAGQFWHRARPSIHMPRWASRITLTVTDVRVQRLQNISEADAWAEGCKPGELNDRGEPFPAEEPHPKCGWVGWDCARDWYADLWDSLHGPDAWETNPWVAAYTFTVQSGNIDSLARPEI